MPILPTAIGDAVLRRVTPQLAEFDATDTADTESDLLRYFGADFLRSIRSKRVVDFGCGTGADALAMAAAGAALVLGLDVQPRRLAIARAHAQRRGLAHRCSFAVDSSDRVDVIVSKDAFEHFRDPARILRKMRDLLADDGYVLASFGPTWYHPLGGHLFSVFPWAHLIFSERSLLRWRARFRDDGATCFADVEGGLNQMTIRRFEQLVAASPLRIAWLDTVPIRGISLLKSRPLREFGSACVRCRLEPR